MNILLTGGTGYIGSHIVVELLNQVYVPIIVDNLSNSNKIVLDRIKKITGKDVIFFEKDIVEEKNFLVSALKQHNVQAVIHLAGYKAVGESVSNPVKYYHNNVDGLISLLHAMEEAECRNLVYSSSATVYGGPHTEPLKEDANLCFTNPYAHTKLQGENILNLLEKTNPHWKIGILRYFNPVGAHESGLIGEDPSGTPNNLFPYVAQVAIKKRPFLNIFGGDYQTHDGTGVRDYIHVVDLALGHIKSIKALQTTGTHTVNLGTGKGYSVLDVVKAYEKASGMPIPYKITGRRGGDVDIYFADSTLASKLLQWNTQYDLDDMCASSWKWQSMNPSGYESMVEEESQ